MVYVDVNRAISVFVLSYVVSFVASVHVECFGSFVLIVLFVCCFFSLRVSMLSILRRLFFFLFVACLLFGCCGCPC